MKVFLIFFICFFIFLSLKAQPVLFNWQQCLGGSDNDYGNSLIPIINGYMLFGGTGSHDGQITSNHGNGDYWLIKTDSLGTFNWSRTFGGSSVEYSCCFKEDPDGGYILFGDTYSNNGNVSGNHGDGDYWIVKANYNGDVLWQCCYGGSLKEVANDMVMTLDSGFLLIGGSTSNDGNITVNHGFYDCWLVKVDPDGNLKWEKSLGGSEADLGISVKTTSDGGFIIAASTRSFDGDVQCTVHGDWETWILKLDSTGNIIWQNCYGGTKGDGANEIILTSDGGYIFAGTTDSNDGDVLGNHGGNDIWVVKIDSIGGIQWQRCYGGSKDEIAKFIRQTDDASYIVGGLTFSHDGDVIGNHSYPTTYDAWLFKITPTGDILWQQCIGGDEMEGFDDIAILSSRNFVLLGGSNTWDHSGDVLCDNHKPGRFDIWLVGIVDTTVMAIEVPNEEPDKVSIYPNPTSDFVNFVYDEPSEFFEQKITILNPFGLIVYETIIPKGKKKVTISVTNLSAGVYFYRITAEGDTKSGKLIVAR